MPILLLEPEAAWANDRFLVDRQDRSQRSQTLHAILLSIHRLRQ